MPVFVFLVRRLFLAALVLAVVTVIDYAMLGDRLGSVFFRPAYGTVCVRRGRVGAKPSRWSKASRCGARC